MQVGCRRRGTRRTTVPVIHGKEGGLLPGSVLIPEGEDVGVRVFHSWRGGEEGWLAAGRGIGTVRPQGRLTGQDSLVPQEENVLSLHPCISLTPHASLDEGGFFGQRLRPLAIGADTTDRSSSPLAECLSMTGSERVCPIALVAWGAKESENRRGEEGNDGERAKTETETKMGRNRERDGRGDSATKKTEKAGREEGTQRAKERREGRSAIRLRKRLPASSPEINTALDLSSVLPRKFENRTDSWRGR